MSGCSNTTQHTKRRGKIHPCEWCNEPIIVGERYRSWLWYDGGERSTVYVHEECCKVWVDNADDFLDYGPNGEEERPKAEVVS